MLHLRRSALACAALLASVGPVLAGPNANGILLLHETEGIVFTDDGDYCGLTSLPGCRDADLSVEGSDPAVFHVLALFPEGSAPRVRAASFGLEYDPSRLTLLAGGHCADFEIATAGWPGPGEGTAVAWVVAQTAPVLEVYWLAGYASDVTLLALSGHPTQGASFGDDSIPSVLDPIGALGALGFGRNGYAPCPGAADPEECTVMPADAYGGFVTTPDVPLLPLLDCVVTVRTTSGNPIPGIEVVAEVAPPAFLCPSAVLTGTTDADGIAHLHPAGGGCVSTPGAVVIYADGVIIRSFDRWKSPDFDGAAASGEVALPDLLDFTAEFLGNAPADCHDYQNDGRCNISDLVVFANSFVRNTICGP